MKHWLSTMSKSILSATQARSDLYKLLAEVISSHQPVTITSKTGNVIMIPEDDWLDIQETLYLLSIPGMRESILQGLKEQGDDCSKELDW